VGLGAEGDCGSPNVVTIPEFLEGGGLGISSFGLVGEELDGTVYRRSGDTCTALPVADALGGRIERLHRVDPIGLLALDSAARGSGPLRTVYTTRDDGVFLRPGAFSRSGGSAGVAYFEDESGTRCTPISTPAGDYKCMPVGGVAMATVRQFADADCTQRVTLLFPGSEAPTGTPTVLFERDSEACGSAPRLRRSSTSTKSERPIRGRRS
jgi:hypothetical protein